jgi:hypothetical protein
VGPDVLGRALPEGLPLPPSISSWHPRFTGWIQASYPLSTSDLRRGGGAPASSNPQETGRSNAEMVEGGLVRRQRPEPHLLRNRPHRGRLCGRPFPRGFVPCQRDPWNARGGRAGGGRPQPSVHPTWTRLRPGGQGAHIADPPGVQAACCSLTGRLRSEARPATRQLGPAPTRKPRAIARGFAAFSPLTRRTGSRSVRADRPGRTSC